MKFKKLLCGVVGVSMLFSQAAVFAAFPDVDEDPTVSWAKPYIDEMTSLGYIKGYEDGTFKPNKTISKVESLVLLSRMIGVDDEENAETLEFALDEYKTKIEKYSSEYEKEVAFLLYRGILKESELADYISVSNRSVPLLRYEAAVLLTKLLGGEEEVLSNAFVSSSYSDTLEIPDSARAYVEYVKEHGIMQGMGNDSNGPVFSPNTGVTRSQMAKMLCTLIDVLNVNYEQGKIVAVDVLEDTITVEIGKSDVDIKILPATKIKIDGSDESFNTLSEGMNIRISYLNDNASLIENIVIEEDATVKGIIASIREGNGKTTLTLADSENTKNTKLYTLSDKVSVIINGAIDSVSKLKTNNYIEATIKDGVIEKIQVINKSETASGTLKSLNADGGETVIVVTDRNGNENEYKLSSNGVNVSRNNLDSSLSSLIIGDTLSMKLTYGKVHTIYAESSTENSTGTIDYIKHSTNGTSIGIALNGKVVEYKVNKNADIYMDSENSDVYKLRPGSDVKIKLESSEIIKLETSSTITASQLVGTVVSVNPTYGLMIVEYNGREYNVFTNANTKIIDSATGNGLKLKAVEKESVVSVTGSNTSGVYEATVIVIQ